MITKILNHGNLELHDTYIICLSLSLKRTLDIMIGGKTILVIGYGEVSRFILSIVLSLLLNM